MPRAAPVAIAVPPTRSTSAILGRSQSYVGRLRARRTRFALASRTRHADPGRVGRHGGLPYERRVSRDWPRCEHRPCGSWPPTTSLARRGPRAGRVRRHRRRAGMGVGGGVPSAGVRHRQWPDGDGERRYDAAARAPLHLLENPRQQRPVSGGGLRVPAIRIPSGRRCRQRQWDRHRDVQGASPWTGEAVRITLRVRRGAALHAVAGIVFRRGRRGRTPAPLARHVMSPTRPASVPPGLTLRIGLAQRDVIGVDRRA